MIVEVDASVIVEVSATVDQIEERDDQIRKVESFLAQSFVAIGIGGRSDGDALTNENEEGDDEFVLGDEIGIIEILFLSNCFF